MRTGRESASEVIGLRGIAAVRRPFGARSVSVLGLAVLIAVVLVPATSAAKSTERFIETGPGPGALAVRDLDGSVYVQSFGADRVQRYDAAGDPIGQFGSSGSGPGEFSFGGVVSGIAIDQDDGSVYVADTGNHRIQRFTAAGAFVAAWGAGVNQTSSGDVCTAVSGDSCGAGSAGSGEGEFNGPLGVAVDPTSGDVYVADNGNGRVQRLSSEGDFELEFSDQLASLPTQVGVDSTGRIYVQTSEFEPIRRYSSSGVFDGQVADSLVSGIIPLSSFAIATFNDHLYVGGAQFFGEFAIIEIDAADTLIDVHRPGVRFHALAAPSSADPLYATAPDSERIEVVTDAGSPAPTATIQPVDGINATSATFHGTVNPNGQIPTRWYFEYSSDGTDWTATAGGTLAAGSADVEVEETQIDLEPSLDYQVRLVASKASLGGPVTTSDATNFATDGAPPPIQPLAAGARTDAAAWLGANVNPSNDETSYYVEYALASDAAYTAGARVPAAPDEADAGSGGQYVTVTQLVTGLQADTAYRFRVVARNEAGTTVGADRTFTTRPVLPTPPAGRGYEMVSPLDKNGTDLDRDVLFLDVATSGAAEQGDGIAYPGQAAFADTVSGAPYVQYLGTRSPSGWTTRSITPPYESETVNPGTINSPRVEYLSPDLQRALAFTNVQLTPGAGKLNGSWGLYRWNAVAPTWQLVSEPWVDLGPDQGDSGIVTRRFAVAGASEDLEHVVFNAEGRPLTAEVPPGGQAVYAWSNGQLELASVLPNGEPATGSVWAGARATLSGQFHPGEHLVSDDGRRVFFAADGRLYVREDGTTTAAVSASERQGDDPALAQLGEFRAAEATGGSRALFTSSQRLTDDATADPVAVGGCVPGFAISLCHDDLYLWNGTAPVGSRLTDLTTDDPTGGGVLGLAAAARDLDRVYFVAAGELADGAIAGQPNLYAWSEDGGLRLIATLSESDAAVWSTMRATQNESTYRDARTTANGTRLVFASSRRLTSHDNAGHRQVYLYDATTEQLECVSCNSSGTAATGDAELFPIPASNQVFSTAPYRLPRNLSADGSAVLFETDQALVARDTNGKADVYQWRDGEHVLISTGQGDHASQFVDASADGRDVFFMTRERLVGADQDDQRDVYDARVGGGFAEQELPPECVGDRCQGELSGTPRRGSDPASEDLRGRGNPRSPVRATLSLAALSRTQRLRLAQGRAVSLRLRVSRPGPVRVLARARIDGRDRVVAAGRQRARRPGPVRVDLRLSRLARRSLSAGRPLTIRLSARMSGAPGPRTLRFELRRPR